MAALDSWRRSVLAIGLVLGLPGCAQLGAAHTPAAVAPLDAADTATTRGYLEVAALREDEADWSGALAKVDKALALQPRSRTALLRRAELLLVTAQAAGSTEGVEDAKAILAGMPAGDDADLALARAWLDAVEGRTDAAVAAAQRAADAAPDDARTQWMAARLLDVQGDGKAALAPADRAVERDPRSHAARRERARAHLRTGDFDVAIPELGDQLRAHPRDYEARALEGETLWRLGNHASAEHSFESIPAGERRASVYAALGWLALHAKQTAAARAVLEDGVAKYPSDAGVLDALLALDEHEQRFGDSLARLDAAVAARPTDPAVARVRARALVAAGRPDEASAAFGHALALAPNDAATYDAIADAFAAAKPEDAERRLAALGAGPAPTDVARGWLQSARGDRAGAIAAQQRAVEADPSLPIARAALARALAANGQDLDRALSLAHDAQAARPYDADIAYAVGLVELKRGQGRAAFDTLGQSIGSYPVQRAGYGELLYTAALALEKAGERESARRGAAIALQHADGDPGPSWKAGAKALVARAAPPRPKDDSIAQSSNPDHKPAAAEGDAPTSPATTPTEPAPAQPPATKPAPAPAAAPAPPTH